MFLFQIRWFVLLCSWVFGLTVAFSKLILYSSLTQCHGAKSSFTHQSTPKILTKFGSQKIKFVPPSYKAFHEWAFNRGTKPKMIALLVPHVNNTLPNLIQYHIVSCSIENRFYIEWLRIINSWKVKQTSIK